MWLYALMSGMSPSVTRAAITGTAYLATAVMVSISPNVLTSVSFQLSFAAMAGIALMAEQLSRWSQRALEARFGV